MFKIQSHNKLNDIQVRQQMTSSVYMYAGDNNVAH